ncbi:MAG: hypothetical protein RL326_196 [Pseudomonadota bacterium]|jgi:hypothetical protein
MAALNKDLQLSAEFITFLRSGFYAQILFEQALTRLETKVVGEDYLETAHKAFDRIDAWINDLVTELPTFSASWTTPETFDAIAAMSFMRELKKDLQWLIPQVEVALRTQNLAQNRDAVKLLVAALIRSAAARGSYVETLHSIYTQLKATDLAQQVAYELEGAKEYVNVTQIILETFSTTTTYDPDLCEKLRKEASLTPCDFRAHIHDTTILLNVYSKEFSFELAEFSKDEAQGWIDLRMSAVAAGYWRAYNFGPEEFMEWQTMGITSAPVAANWRRARFLPREAVGWIREGIPPVLASQWLSTKLEPARVAALLQKGITDPTQAPRSSREERDELAPEEDGGQEDF